MLKALIIKKLDRFVGRTSEKKKLQDIGSKEEPSIVVVYGRRRVGKTELLEQVYAERGILKFEGIHKKSEADQKRHVLWQLGQYLGDPWIAKTEVSTWVEVFKAIYDHIPEGKWTIYFEEVQWLADYQEGFISELKFAWDNYFRHRSGWVVVLCGSSPSFIVNHVIFSKSLYNRSQVELHLKEFSLSEAVEFMGSLSHREVMDAYLTVGGIPEYLKWCKSAVSVFLSICKNSFTSDAFFAKEHDRIFISSLAESKHYKTIIEYLADERFASRDDILQYLDVGSSGAITDILRDLEMCGFIEKYSSYHLSKKSSLARYCISDHYIQFYFKFIHPLEKEIRVGKFNDNPCSAIKMDTYQKWLGFAFERFCRRNNHLIAKILGFHGILYEAGAYYNKATTKEDKGYQIDLVFDRADHVITLCEIKYTQSKIGTDVIEDFEKKVSLFPLKGRKTLQKVLIASEGATDALLARHYFDYVIGLEDLFRFSK